MDIKKFIASDKIDNDYNKMIHIELDAIKRKMNSDNINCLYKVSECDFLKTNISISEMCVDSNIVEFEETFIDSHYLTHLTYSGPMIKQYLDLIHESSLKTVSITTSLTSIINPSIKNYYIVTYAGTKNKSRDIFKLDVKLDTETKIGYYTFNTSKSVFYLDKKSSPYLSHAILSNNNPLDRIALANNELWVSGMFILDLYKKISWYDPKNVDPYFGYPEDILDIYDRMFINKTKSTQNAIDMINIDGLQKINKSQIENIFIVSNNQKYTAIEYAVLKMMDYNHPVIICQMRHIIMFLYNFQYFRPPFFVAKMIGFDRKYPGLYEALIEIKHKINIDPLNDIKSLESVYHIDMFIINYMIINDDADQLINYISKMGIMGKFKQYSKTVEKIIDWLIEHRAINIMIKMIDSEIISVYHKYKVIFLTQEFNLLGKEYINKYILNTHRVHDVSKTHVSQKRNIKARSGLDRSQVSHQCNRKRVMENNNVDNSNIDNSNVDGSNIDNPNIDNPNIDNPNIDNPNIDNPNIDNPNIDNPDDINNSVNENGSNNVILVTDLKYPTDGMEHNEHHVPGVMDKIELDIDEQNMILEILQDVITRGLTRSFYVILKMFPFILDTGFTFNVKNENVLGHIVKQKKKIDKTMGVRGNILHEINSDKSVEILEIILKTNPSIIDDKDENNLTPLIKYARIGLGKCITLLIKNNADYEITDNESNTFLHILCENNNLDIIQNVIRNISDIIDFKNDKMMTPAMIATQNKNEEIFYILKGLNAKLDCVDIYGNTVYHYICKSKICPGIMVPNKRNKFGFTPHDYCSINHNFYYFQDPE
jgi:hypothetical protein